MQLFEQEETCTKICLRRTFGRIMRQRAVQDLDIQTPAAQKRANHAEWKRADNSTKKFVPKSAAWLEDDAQHVAVGFAPYRPPVKNDAQLVILLQDCEQRSSLHRACVCTRRHGVPDICSAAAFYTRTNTHFKTRTCGKAALLDARMVCFFSESPKDCQDSKSLDLSKRMRGFDLCMRVWCVFFPDSPKDCQHSKSLDLSKKMPGFPRVRLVANFDLLFQKQSQAKYVVKVACFCLRPNFPAILSLITARKRCDAVSRILVGEKIDASERKNCPGGNLSHAQKFVRHMV